MTQKTKFPYLYEVQEMTAAANFPAAGNRRRVSAGAERPFAGRRTVSIPIRLKWADEETGEAVISEGFSINVGEKTLTAHVIQDPLPKVGSRINLFVVVEESKKDRRECSFPVEVIRVDRDPSYRQAALKLVETSEQWQKEVWDLAEVLIEKARQIDREDWD